MYITVKSVIHGLYTHIHTLINSFLHYTLSRASKMNSSIPTWESCYVNYVLTMCMVLFAGYDGSSTVSPYVPLCACPPLTLQKKRSTFPHIVGMTPNGRHSKSIPLCHKRQVYSAWYDSKMNTKMQYVSSLKVT